MLDVAQAAWDTQGWLVDIGLAEAQYEAAKTALEQAKKALPA